MGSKEKDKYDDIIKEYLMTAFQDRQTTIRIPQTIVRELNIGDKQIIKFEILNKKQLKLTLISDIEKEITKEEKKILEKYKNGN